MPNPVGKFRRSEAQKAADRARIAKLHLSGWSSYEIAEEIARVNPYSLNPHTIRKDILKCEELWREAAISSIDRKKAVAAERLNKMMHEAWDAWEKSKAASIERTTVGVPKSQGEGGQALKETRVTTKESHGDPAYLHVVLSCIQELNKLYGLYAPVRAEVGGIPGGAPITVTDVVGGIDPEHAHRVLEDEFRFKYALPANAEETTAPAQQTETQNDDDSDDGETTDAGTTGGNQGAHEPESGMGARDDQP